MDACNIINKWRNQYDLYLTRKRMNLGANYLQFDLKSPAYDCLLNWLKSDLFLRCTAITYVDYYETNHSDSMNVNSLSCKKLSEMNNCTERFIYIAIDEAFDGIERLPNEASVANPLNYYKFTKSLDENYVTSSGIHFSIVSIAILWENYSFSLKTFTECIYASLKQHVSITF